MDFSLSEVLSSCDNLEFVHKMKYIVLEKLYLHNFHEFHSCC